MSKTVILGAGVDSLSGIAMPLTSELIPQISDFVQTEIGKRIDEKLRLLLPRLRFSFESFVKRSIDKLADEFRREIDTITTNIEHELETNHSLSNPDRKMGELVNRLLRKIKYIQEGAEFDEETEDLIQEVLGRRIEDEAIIDIKKLSFTDTFKSILQYVLEQSVRNSTNPILRHVYKNLLDIEDLMVKYFIGFYTRKDSDIKTYVYISWMLWAFLKEKEKQVFNDETNHLPFYSQLQDDWNIITFNYTSFARQKVANSKYFHGSLFDYINMYNRTMMSFEENDYYNTDTFELFERIATPNIDFTESSKKIVVPAILPPLRIKPVLSSRFISTWYESAQQIIHSDKIIIAGYSFSNTDEHFNDILRGCRDKNIYIIDPVPDLLINNLHSIWSYRRDDFSLTSIQNKETLKAGSLSLIKASADEIILGNL